MPADGAFSFETTELSPGEYVVAAQLMAAYDPPEAEKNRFWRTAVTSRRYLSFSADKTQPLNIDLGNVTLPVPAAVVDLKKQARTHQQAWLHRTGNLRIKSG